MKHLLLLCVLAISVFAQATNTFQLTAPAPTRPSSTFILNVNLTGSGLPAAFQFNVNAPADITAITVADGTSTTAASKQVQCSPYTAGSMTCIVYGLNQTTIATGQVAIITATLSGTPTQTSEIFSLTNSVEADMSGVLIASTISPVSVTGSILSNCDLNGDGVTNVADVNLMISWVLGTATPPSGISCDVNNDTKCNVDDAQIIVNASQGLACTAIKP